MSELKTEVEPGEVGLDAGLPGRTRWGASTR